MNILEKKINDLINNQREIDAEIRSIEKKLRKFRREQKRATNEDSKRRIQEVQIDPLLHEIKGLDKKNSIIDEQLTLCEYIALGEEMSRRDKQLVPTSEEPKRSIFLRRLRRFGNFEGFLAGRHAELEDLLKERILNKKIKQEFDKQKEITPKLSDKQIRSMAKDLVLSKTSSAELLGIIDREVDAFLKNLNLTSGLNSTGNPRKPSKFWERIAERTPSQPETTPNVGDLSKFENTNNGNVDHSR